jgi:integrase
MPRPKPIRPPKQHERSWHEGTVKEIRPGVWRAWRERVKGADGKTTRPSKTFQGDDAEQRAKTWAKGDVQPAVLELRHWLDRWLVLKKPTLARNTYSIYRRHVEACAPLATRPLADLTVDEWQALTNQLLGRWSRHHVYVWRGNIMSALARAVPRHMPENPLAHVKLPRADEQPPKAWRQDEVDRLLAAADGGLHETWLLFTLGTGVRLGESRGLMIADLDLVTRTATIRQSADNQDSTIGPTKTRKVRVIDVPDEAVPYLSTHIKRLPAGETFVFGHNGHPYDSNSLRRWLALQCKAAKVRPLPPHSLRHSYASLALDDGVPVQDIARQLGHTVSTLQRIYAHFIGDGQRRAARAVGKALRHRFSGPKRVPRAKNGTRDGA